MAVSGTLGIHIHGMQGAQSNLKGAGFMRYMEPLNASKVEFATTTTPECVQFKKLYLTPPELHDCWLHTGCMLDAH